MKSNNKWLIGIVLIIVAATVVYGVRKWKTKEEGQTVTFVDVVVFKGDIKSTIVTTGSVEPQNRLEVKPPIGGRIEKILVEEGDKVKKAQLLAWISSTERAALLDAALSRGEKELEYWAQVYKPTMLVAPIDGEVIVRDVEPGQTINANSVVVVLSDRLIVEARVDETDIGSIKVGQPATVTLDAYRDITAGGIVDHISYESDLVNNVIIYEVEIVLDTVPGIFRSGMSAEVSIVYGDKKGVPLLPVSAVEETEDGSFVLLRGDADGENVWHPVETGLEDDENIEITDGLNVGDNVVVRKEAFSMNEIKDVNNPFSPFTKRKKRERDSMGRRK